MNFPIIERYSGKETCHPGIPAIGKSRQRKARSGLKLHEHPHYEVVLMEKGNANWVSAGKIYRLSGPCVFLTRPHESHGSISGMIEPCSISWLQFSVQHLAKDLALMIAELEWTLRPLPSQLLDIFGSIFHEIKSPRETTPRMLDALLSQFLILLSRLKKEAEHQLSPGIEKVVEAVKKNPRHPWSHGDLERISGLKHTQLNLKFHRELGQTPRAFAMECRLREGHRSLREENTDITTLAHELGFNSSQHFASSFKKQFGITPSQCRKEDGF